MIKIKDNHFLKASQLSYLLSVLFILCLQIFSQKTFANSTTEEIKQESTVRIVGRGPVVPMSKDQSIPITSVNVKWIDIDILKANNPAEFLPNHYFNQNLDRWDLGELNQSFTSVYIDRYTISNESSNTQISSRIKIPKRLAAGWYVMVLKPAGNYQSDKVQIRHLLITDLGIQAKVYQNNIHIRAANLHNGRVLNHGTAKLYREGKLIEETALDEFGEATFFNMPNAKEDGIKNDVIYVESGDQISYLSLKEIPLDLSEFTIGGKQHHDINVFVYSNRDLIRPGEALPIHMLLKDSDGKNIASQPLNIRLVNPKQVEVFNKRIQAQHQGYYDTKILTDTSWPKGRYTLEVRTNPKMVTPLQSFRFQIEEFTPERMDLTATTDTAKIIAGQSINYQVEGRYLFGTPADGNTVQSSVNYQTTQHFLGKYNDFYVGQQSSLPENYKDLDEIKLTKQGIGTIQVPTPAAEKLLSPIYAVTHFSLLESSGAAVQRQDQKIIWRDTNIPAVRPNPSTFTYASQATFDIALLNATGDATVTGEIEATFEHDQGRYYWVYEEGNGWSRHEQDRWTNVEQRLIDSKDITQIQFPVTWGDYKLTLKDTKTGVSTVYEFYAGWYAGDQQQQVKPDQISINLDKAQYDNGDSILATIHTPAEGDITLSVESDHQLWSKTLHVKKGKQQITIPVSEDWNRHDLYITSLLTSNINGLPKRYFGITPLILNRMDRKLLLKVDLPDFIRPLKEVTIPVHVDQIKDTDDTWVTLSLVDKGIINLSRFKPENPYDFYYGQKRYQADIIDLYSRLYDTRPDPFAIPKFGSDLVQRTKNKNDDLAEIKTITWMSKAVKVQNGIATFKLIIPDYNGSVQIIATAFNSEQYGQKVMDKVVSATTVVELGAPKFFAPGDESSLAVDITNKSDSDQTYTLHISTSNPSINIIGNTNITFDLKDKKTTSLRLPLLISDEYEQLSNTFVIDISNADKAHKIDIKRTWTVPIRPVTPVITTKHELILKPEQQYTINTNLWDSLYWLKENPGYLTASYSQPIDINSSIKSLFDYPYGCTEQVTSTAYPFLLQSPILEKAKQAVLDKKNYTENTALEMAVHKLAQRQLSNGGFSLWDSGTTEDYWVTVYTTEFLLKVKQFDPSLVPDKLLSKALGRVTHYVKSPNTVAQQTPYKGQSEAIIAYATYVASSNGRLSWNDINHSKKYVMPWPSQLAKLYVAASYAKVGSFNETKELLSSINKEPRLSHYFGDYGSVLRDNAIAVTILDKLSNIDAISTQAQRLKNEALLVTRSELIENQWLSTQENNSTVQAGLIAYQDNQETVSLLVDNLPLSKTGLISFDAMPEQTITNTGDKNLIIDILAKGYPKHPSQMKSTIPAKQQTKEMYYPDGRIYKGEPLKVGERLMVRITITTEDAILDSLLVDLMPAGFTLENPHLHQGPDINSLLPDDVELSTADHIEYHADRFVVASKMKKNTSVQFAYLIRAEAPGKYQIPSTLIESMYRPELRLIIKPSIAKIEIKEAFNHHPKVKDKMPEILVNQENSIEVDPVKENIIAHFIKTFL